MSTPPSPSTQELIRKLGADIKARTQNLLPPRQPRPEAGSSSVAPPVQLPQNSDSIPVDNAYALELFQKHTNVREIVEKWMPQRSDNAKQRYVVKYYNRFVQRPHMRIRVPLDEIRFTSQAHEGVFRMVQKMHLTSAVELKKYKEMLQRNNVQQMFFVDMTIDNCCLDYQQEIIQKLKSRFTNWSAKLDKLPTYLLSAHKVRQAADRYFLRLVKRSSSVKHSQLLTMPHVVEEFVRESRIPSERRVNILWRQLEFDDDALNQKYECGEYSKFRFKYSLLEPVESLECEYYNPQERCITPGNIRSERSDDIGPTEVVVKQSEKCPPNQENIEQSPVAEDGTEMETTTNSYERVNAEQKLAIPGIARIEPSNEIVRPENVVQQREQSSPAQEMIEPSPPPAPEKATATVATTSDITITGIDPSNEIDLREDVVPQREESSPAQEIIEPTPAPPQNEATDMGTTSNGCEPIYTMEYISTHTNVYEALVCGLMKKKNFKPPSESKLSKMMQSFFEYYRDIFTRGQLPDCIRLITPEEQMELKKSGPLKWAMEKLQKTQTPCTTASLQPAPPSLSPSPPTVPSHRPLLPPRPTTAANEPKRKQQKKDPILGVVATRRPGRIQYDSEESSLTPGDVQKAVDVTAELNNNQSIAFVSIPMAQLKRPSELRSPIPASVANPSVSQDVSLLDSLGFEPFASSTQDQASVPEVQNTQADVPAATQDDPLLLTQTTIPPLCPLNPYLSDGSSDGSDSSNVTVRQQQQNLPTPSEGSSVIPPFQVPLEQQAASSSPPIVVSGSSNDIVKQEREESQQQQLDTSGYEDDVIVVPNPEPSCIVIDDSGDEQFLEDEDITSPYPAASLANAVSQRYEDSHNTSADGRQKPPIKVEERHSISPPRIGKYISLESQRARPFASFPLATTKVTVGSAGPSPHMIFLTHIDIQSIRYSINPTIWPQSNVLQHNPLTVNINPPREGIFTAPVRDHHACQLFGLSAGGKGREALLAALQHTGKFRYGTKEPKKEFYRLTITEKVLHLFFATVSPCPIGGSGLVMLLDSRSSLPADGDEGRLESFNYYAHAKGSRLGWPQSAGTENKGKKAKEECLSQYLMPGIAKKMKTLREGLQNTKK